MKKIVIGIVMVLMTMGTFAQTNPNNITVNGMHEYKITPEYSAKMIISMANIYDAMASDLEGIKASYFKKLEKIGIAKDRLKEDDMQYALIGYDKGGTVIVFKTTSFDELEKFLKIKSMGVTKSEVVFKTTLTDVQMADYAKEAFDDATKRATEIAKKIGRKIGKPIAISDTNTKKISESLYYDTNLITTREYTISISFELL